MKMTKKEKRKKKRNEQKFRLAVISLLSNPKVKIQEYEIEYDNMDITTNDSQGFKYLPTGIQEIKMKIWKKPKKEKKSDQPEKIKVPLASIILKQEEQIVATICEGTLLIYQKPDRQRKWLGEWIVSDVKDINIKDNFILNTDELFDAIMYGIDGQIFNGDVYLQGALHRLQGSGGLVLCDTTI